MAASKCALPKTASCQVKVQSYIALATKTPADTGIDHSWKSYGDAALTWNKASTIYQTNIGDV
jgi:hypothetical protein